MIEMSNLRVWRKAERPSMRQRMPTVSMAQAENIAHRRIPPDQCSLDRPILMIICHRTSDNWAWASSVRDGAQHVLDGVDALQDHDLLEVSLLPRSLGAVLGDKRLGKQHPWNTHLQEEL